MDYRYLQMKTVLCILVCIAFAVGCGGKPNATPQGGGDWGGGDLRLQSVKETDIASAAQIAMQLMPEYFQNWELALALEEPGKSHAMQPVEDSVKLASLNQQVLATASGFLKSRAFRNRAIYKAIAANRVAIAEKDCHTEQSQTVDASATQEGVICLSSQRITEKVNSLHLYASVVGLIAHELAHKLDGSEEEARAIEDLFSFTIDNNPSRKELRGLANILRGLRLTLSDSIRDLGSAGSCEAVESVQHSAAQFHEYFWIFLGTYRLNVFDVSESYQWFAFIEKTLPYLDEVYCKDDAAQDRTIKFSSSTESLPLVSVGVATAGDYRIYPAEPGNAVGLRKNFGEILRFVDSVRSKKTFGSSLENYEY